MATDTSTTNFSPIGFDIVRRLGRGAAFEVAVVRDVHGTELICKRAAHAGAADAVDREVEVLRNLRAASFPELVTTGTDGRGGFLVETRARGVALRDLIADGRAPVDADRWVDLAQASARALADLHALADAQGALDFVHGDISPDNLFFESPATITFVDFSSATWRQAPSPAFAGDRGTVPYAAPELLRQEGRATAECDTYALAATLLAVAVAPPLVHATSEAGRLYEAASEGILWKRIEERDDLPPAFRSALAEALQYEPGRRLTSARDLAARFSSQATHDMRR
jgi:serine/threonine protein kinase